MDRAKGNIDSKSLEIFLLALVLATLLLKESLNSIALIIYFVFWIFTKKYLSFKFDEIRQIGPYLILVGAYLIWIFYRNFESLEWYKAIDFLAKQGSLILFPLLLLCSDVRANEKKTLDTIFFYMVFIFSCYLYLSVFLKYLEIGEWYITDPNHPTWKYYLYSSGRLSPNIHPTFLSMLIVYCICSYYPIFKSKKKQVRHGFDILIFVCLVTTLLLLSSRGALFSLLIVFLLFQIKEAVNGNYKRLGNMIAVLLVFFFLFSSYGPLKRLSKLQMIARMDVLEIANTQNSTGKRVQIYLIAKEMVKENFWFGVGTKNWQIMNKDYYDKYYKGDFDYGIDTLNTHNQYLNALVSWGIIGLFLLVSIIFCQIYFASFLDRSALLFFWCFIVILLLTENLLNRHIGIVFLSLVSGFTIQQFQDNRKFL